MAAPRAFKVVPYEIGAANVIDRDTNERVGYVVEWANGWEAFELYAFEDGKRGVSITTRRFKYRLDAAECVWTTHLDRKAAV